MARVSPSQADGSRTAILVLGMHRSGTSALTRVLSLCGASLPKNPLVVSAVDPDDGNTMAGHWESETFRKLNDGLLQSAGSGWDDAAPFPRAWFASPACEAGVTALVQAFQQEFGEARLVVVKDPRICRLVPVWAAVLEQLQVTPAWVIPIRNPLEVAASLKLRNGVPTAKGLLLWLQYFLAAERDTRGLARCFVTYDELLRSWRGAVSRIAKELEIGLLGRSARTDAAVEEFLDERLRHQRVSREHLESAKEVSPWIKQVYSWALDACSDPQAPPHELDQVTAQLSIAETTFASLLLHLDTGRGLEREQAETGLLSQATAVADVRRRCDGLSAELSELRRQSEERWSSDSEWSERLLDTRSREVDDLNAQVQVLRQQGQELQLRADDLQRLADRLQGRTDELQRQTDELQQRGEELGSDTAQLRASSFTAMEQLTHETTGLRERIEETRIAGTAAVDLVRDELDRRWSQMQSGLDELAQQLDELRGDDRGVRLWAASMRTLEEYLARYHDSLARKEAHLLRLSGRTAELEEDLRRAEDRVRTAQDQLVSAVATRLARLDGKLERVEQTIPAATTDLARRLDDRLRSLRQELDLRGLMLVGVDRTSPQRHRPRYTLRYSLAGLVVRVPLWIMRPGWRRRLTDWLDARLIWRCGLFRAGYYLARYPDVTAMGIDPLVHFVACGSREHRDPNPLFDTGFYLGTYPDVAASGINPLVHYVTCGATEGRDPSPLFNTAHYLSAYPEVAAAGINPLLHFLEQGIWQGRSPGGD